MVLNGNGLEWKWSWMEMVLNGNGLEWIARDGLGIGCRSGIKHSHLGSWHLRPHSGHSYGCRIRCLNSWWCTASVACTVRCPAQWDHCPGQTGRNGMLLPLWTGIPAAYTPPVDQDVHTCRLQLPPEWSPTTLLKTWEYFHSDISNRACTGVLKEGQISH